MYHYRFQNPLKMLIVGPTLLLSCAHRIVPLQINVQTFGRKFAVRTMAVATLRAGVMTAT